MRRLLFSPFLPALIAVTGSAFAESYHLVENFTEPLPSSPQVTAEAEMKEPKVGLASARLTYRMNPKTHVAILDVGDKRQVAGAPGILKLWVKGDKSGNELELVLRHGRPETTADNRKILAGQTDLPLRRVKLDFDEWREVTFDVAAIPAGNVCWWQRLGVYAPPKTEVLTGVIGLDDLRFVPETNPPVAQSVVSLIGPPAREFGTTVELSLDLRNFTKTAAKVRTRITMTDRNENTVADREFEIDVAAGESKEARLALAPENLGNYLPPFKLAGDVLSAELQDLSARVDTTLVMGNSRFLFDDFSDVFGRWFNIGTPAPPRANLRTWISWTSGEAQRATPLVQTSSRISRVDVAPGPKTPPSRYALHVDYQGDAVVYSGRPRYLPGDAYRLGLWVKGDGSNTRLSALFLDYTHGADFYEGGWKRILDGDREITTLDFTDWRYFEVELPGRGIGSNTPNGSTPNLDFPLELTAFHLEAAAATPAAPAPAPAPATPAAPAAPVSGSVEIGPIHVFTQQALSSSLAVQIGYDDPQSRWQPTLGASVNVQNSALTGARKVKANWSLLDRGNEPIASGQVDQDLPAGEAKSFRLDLAKYAGEIEKKAAPYYLQVTAYDVADGSVSTTRQLILTRPDSHAVVADFEAERGYLGLKAREIKNAPEEGEAAAFTSTEQAHGGKRSLLIEWDRASSPQRFISIDPPLPGIPVDLSVWVHGDGSGVLFYPLIGDRKGINHGLPNGQWNLFLPRTEDPLQNAVRVDWTGWRELKFRLPPVGPNWAEPSPALGFVPNYPLGVHLAIDATGVEAATGKLYVDDISVNTHLVPEKRVELTMERSGESNFHPPGSPVHVTIANYDLTAPRKVVLSGGLFDWRGTRVAGLDKEIELPPGSRQSVEIAKDFPPGFYQFKVTLAENTKPGAPAHNLGDLDEDLLVGDPAATLGADWKHVVNDEWALRKPIQERFSFVDEDWDWVEQHPGNLQVDTIRQRARRISGTGGEPYMLLGYSSFWAAGPGYDQMLGGHFLRILRDRGHAVNTFLLPKRLDDWDNYVEEVMRGAGRDVSGWVVWDGADSPGPMGFPVEKFMPFLKSIEKWRDTYCADKPVLLGGLARETALPYLQQLGKAGGLSSITGVNVRLDVGRLSPEDAGVVGYSRELRETLNPPGTKSPKTVLFTNLDWVVEKNSPGLNAFDQAAYLARTALLVEGGGLHTALTLRNEDFVRLGFGLAYRRDLWIPPMQEKPAAYQFKPAYLAMARVRQWLSQSPVAGELEVQDVVAGRTRGLWQKGNEGQGLAILWRNDTPGWLSFAETGVTVTAAEDLFGATVPLKDGGYAIGKVPCRFTITSAAEPMAQALSRLQVRDGAAPLWPQRVLAAFPPVAGGRQEYAQTGGTPATLAGRTATGDTVSWPGLNFAANGTEKFRVAVPAGASLILRKQFLLDDTGHSAEVLVNGKPVGKWNLLRTEKELSGGLRESIFIVDQAALAGQAQAQIEVRYLTPANTAGWRVLEWREGEFPLSAVGPIHADQNVGSPHFARNVVGSPLQIGTVTYANGIGTFARSLLEFPINGQFRRFTAKVGVDAVTEGRGSVTFEVYGDGKKLWASPTLSGLDAPKEIDLDVTGINRLRLIVTDGGDGNKFDVADWCEPVLLR